MKSKTKKSKKDNKTITPNHISTVAKKHISNETPKANLQTDDDEYAKALADVVEQVVSKSFISNEKASEMKKKAETPRAVIPPIQKRISGPSSLQKQQQVIPKEKVAQKSKSVKETKHKKDVKKQKPEKTHKLESVEEPFDMNAIMKNAMDMAFQNHESNDLDTSVIEEFNRGLGDMTIADILAPKSLKAKKKMISKKKSSAELDDRGSDKSKSKLIATKSKLPDKVNNNNHRLPSAAVVTPSVVHETNLEEKKKDLKAKDNKTELTDLRVKTLPSSQQIKVFKVNAGGREAVNHDASAPILHKIKFSNRSDERQKTMPVTKTIETTRMKLSKQYLAAVNEAVSLVKKKRAALNKQKKEEERRLRQERKEQKKLKKLQEKEKKEKESRELEEIVAKGPPYPADLRLTKSGRPKKPYRRWTKEEMEARVQKSTEEALKPKKVKKVKKKKDKKPKKLSLNALKKIPLFNLSKGLTPLMASLSYLSDGKSSRKDSQNNNIVQKSNNMSSEEMAMNAAKNQKNATNITYYDPSCDAIVRKEIIEYHPPWVIPNNPPLTLPVVTLLRRDAIDKLVPSGKASKRKKKTSEYGTVSAREKMMSSILGPIVNTLKAAAKAKTASGASPEEASKYLATIIQYTKNTIVKALLNARSSQLQSIKTETSVRLDSPSLTNGSQTIPIFNSRKIVNSGNREGNLISPKKGTITIDDKEDTTKKHAVPIKIEEEVTIHDFAPVRTQIPWNNYHILLSNNDAIKEYERLQLWREATVNDICHNNGHINDISNDDINMINSAHGDMTDDGEMAIDPSLYGMDKSASHPIENNIEPVLSHNNKTSQPTSMLIEDNELHPPSTKHIEKNFKNTPNSVGNYAHIVDINDESHSITIDVGVDESVENPLSEINETHVKFDNPKPTSRDSDAHISTGSNKADNHKSSDENNTSEEIGSQRNFNSNDNDKGPLINRLIREQLIDLDHESQKEGSMPDFSDLISNTLSSVLPEIEKSATTMKKPRKVNKETPNNVLNLDGLVPPVRKIIKKEESAERLSPTGRVNHTLPKKLVIPLNNISNSNNTLPSVKTEEKSVVKKEVVKIVKPRPVTPTFSFNIPNLKTILVWLH